MFAYNNVTTNIIYIFQSIFNGVDVGPVAAVAIVMWGTQIITI